MRIFFHRRLHPRPAEGGQSVVEFALAASLFFVLIWSIFDVGRAVWYQNTLQDAVQEATRYAVVHSSTTGSPVGPGDGNYSAGPPTTDSTLTTIVDKHATLLNNSNISVTSSWPQGANAIGDQVTVTATYPYVAINTFFGSINLTLSASSTRNIVT